MYYYTPVSVPTEVLRRLPEVLLGGIQAGLMDHLVGEAVRLEQLVEVIGGVEVVQGFLK
jgi:hypothetical protein